MHNLQQAKKHTRQDTEPTQTHTQNLQTHTIHANSHYQNTNINTSTHYKSQIFNQPHIKKITHPHTQT